MSTTIQLHKPQYNKHKHDIISDNIIANTIIIITNKVSQSHYTEGVVFRAWGHERAPLNSQWLVHRISGADFLHCWVANSIWLERAESLITKR